MEEVVLTSSEEWEKKEPAPKKFPLMLVLGLMVILLLVVVVAAYAGIITIPGITPSKVIPKPPEPLSEDDELPPPLPDAA